MKVVVTGGAGFIGSHIADRFVARGDDVVVIDDLRTGLESNVPSAARLERLDVADAHTHQDLYAIRPQVIVHCAAQASVAGSFQAPADDARTNIVGTLRVMEGAIAAGVSRLVFLATGGAIYGDTGTRPAREDHRRIVRSPYGLGKWTAEQYLTALPMPGAPVTTVLRLANVYGPRQRGDGEGGVVSAFIARMRTGGPVEVFGDGRQTRDFVYVADVVDAVLAAATSGAAAVVNIGTGRRTSINDLLATLVEMTGYDGRVVHGPVRVGDIRHSSLDPARASEVLSWHPRTSLQDGLRLTLAHGLDLGT